MLLFHWLAQAAAESDLFGIEGLDRIKAIRFAGSLATIFFALRFWFRVGDGPVADNGLADNGRADQVEADRTADLRRDGPPRFNG